VTLFTVYSDQLDNGLWHWWASADWDTGDATEHAYIVGDTLATLKARVAEVCELEGWSEPLYVLAPQENHVVFSSPPSTTGSISV